MNVRPRTAIVAATLVAGCATSTPHDDGIDHPHVAAVERAARGRGVDIHWINLPQRRPTAAPSTPDPSGPPAGT